jgi:chromosome segregation ATPase
MPFTPQLACQLDCQLYRCVWFLLNVLLQVDNLFQRIHELDEITKQRDLFRETYCRLDQQRATEFMEGFALISSRLKEMFRMISMGGDAELEVVDILDLFGCGVQFS